MSSKNIDTSVLHRIDRIRQIILDLDENIEGKYQGYYPSSDQADQILQNLDEEGISSVDVEEYRINRLKYEDTFLKDVHNILDVYNLCTSSFATQIEKIGIKQISMFIKQLILSHRKSMILALRIVCSYHKVPQVIDERKFKISTYEVQQEVVKEANAKKYNQKKVKIQRGTVDKDLVYLIKNDLFDKPDMVPENIKLKLGQIYDPLMKEYREAQDLMNETLSNKQKYLNMQPSHVEDYMSVTLKDIENTANSFYNFEAITRKGNQSREEINQLSNKFCSDMIMDELSKEIKDNFEDSARKRMQNVIIQVLQFLQRKNAEQLPSVQCQTEVSMEELEKQIQEAEKEARANKWEVEAIKSNIRTLSLKNEELIKDLEQKNKKISDLNQQIIDQLATIEKLKHEITISERAIVKKMFELNIKFYSKIMTVNSIQNFLRLRVPAHLQHIKKQHKYNRTMEIQYDLKLQRKIADYEQKQKLMENDLLSKNEASKKKFANSFTQTGKVNITNENNHIYASQKHYSSIKRRFSHDLQLEGRVDYFYKLKKIKDELDRNPKKRKRLNIPQEITLRTENRAMTKMQKQLQVLQMIKEQEQEILNLRQQNTGIPATSISPLLTAQGQKNGKYNLKRNEEMEIRGTSSKLISQEQLDHIYAQYSESKSLVLKTQQEIQVQQNSIEIQTDPQDSRKGTTTADAVRQKQNKNLGGDQYQSVQNNQQPSNLDSLLQQQQQHQQPKQQQQQYQQQQQLQQKQKGNTNQQNVYQYIEELKKSQHEIFKNFSTEQINEIEEFIISKELGIKNIHQQYSSAPNQVFVNGQLVEQSQTNIQLVFDEYQKLQPYKELIDQLRQIDNEGERVYIVGILHNYICKLQRRKRQMSRRAQNNSQYLYKLSPDSHSLSPSPQQKKYNTKDDDSNQKIYEEESEKKDGFQSYKHFQDRLKNHQQNTQIQKNRQRASNSFHTVSSTNFNFRNLNDPISKIDYEKYVKEFLTNEQDSPPKHRTPTKEHLNKSNYQVASDQKEIPSEKKMKIRLRRQNSIDRCENLNLPALNIIQKAQEHLQQFEQSVTLQNYKKLHNKILSHKRLKTQNDDMYKSKNNQLQNKSFGGLAPLSEDDPNTEVLTDEAYQQTYQLLTQNHEQMLECVQIFQNNNKGQTSSLNSEQAKQLLKQSKYPFQSIQYPFQSIQSQRYNGPNNFDVTFIIWKNQFTQLPAPLKSYIVKKALGTRKKV